MRIPGGGFGSKLALSSWSDWVEVLMIPDPFRAVEDWVKVNSEMVPRDPCVGSVQQETINSFARLGSGEASPVPSAPVRRESRA